MAFKRIEFKPTPPPSNGDINALNSWRTLEQIRIDVHFDEERKRIDDYFGRRMNIANRIVLGIYAFLMLLNVIIVFACIAHDIHGYGGNALAAFMLLLLLCVSSYREGYERYEPVQKPQRFRHNEEDIDPRIREQP